MIRTEYCGVSVSRDEGRISEISIDGVYTTPGTKYHRRVTIKLTPEQFEHVVAFVATGEWSKK